MSTLFRSITRAFQSRPDTKPDEEQPAPRFPQSQPPKAPSPALRLDALKVLSRLELIPEFRPYLYAHDQTSRTDKFKNPVRILWHCFALGKPLCVLLDLLGSPGNRYGSQNGVNLEDEESRLYFQSFLERLHVSEQKGQVPYGEVLRESDLWDGTNNGFARVLRTVRRLLTALQESYPGLYRSTTNVDRLDVLKNLIHSERTFITGLKQVFEALAPVQAAFPTLHPCLEFLQLNQAQLITWHEELLAALELQYSDADSLDSCNWQAIFATSSPLASVTIRTHRAICANWDWVGLSGIRGSLVQLLSLNQRNDDDIQRHIKLLLKMLPRLPARINEYTKRLSAVLEISLPSLSPPAIPELSRMPSMASLSSSFSSASSSPSVVTITPSFIRVDPYDSLCATLFELQHISSSVDEMCVGFRELGVLELLRPHLNVDIDKFGPLLLDDRSMLQGRNQRGKVDDGELSSVTPCSLFLFEHVFLCFFEVDPPYTDLDLQHQESHGIVYPILPWQMGSACRRIEVINNMKMDSKERSMTLQLIHVIRTADLRVLRYSDHSFPHPAFEIEWSDSSSQNQTLQFTTATYEEQNQWCEVLESFVHAVSVLRPPVVPRTNPSVPAYCADGSEDDSTSDYDEYYRSSEDDDDSSYPNSLQQFDPNLDLAVVAEDGRRMSYPRPWSLIARKGPRSETSSFIQQEEDRSQLSPGVLPSLFANGIKSRSLSPISLNGNGKALTDDDIKVNYKRSSLSSIASSTQEDFPPQPNGHAEESSTEDSTLLDLTGKIIKQGRFPEAHGGFSDIWKGLWREGDHEVKVAVKVLRSKVDDPLAEAKMTRRLNRELSLWSSLRHPNILPLYGTTTDFGHYESMVCPWLEHGSVSRYMEQHGDILSMRDRLQLLCEVSEGLRYLHSFSIVHGDLSGANVLINNKGKACLADFGLSSIVAEFKGTSFFTSNIGGAVRWADSRLYRLPPADEDGEQTAKEPVMGPWCDIYSFGSVTLELLSGRIPYHYIRSDAQVVIELHKGVKPRRPAPSFVTDSQWDFIRQCWLDQPEERPNIDQVCQSIQILLKACVEFRKRPSVRSART